MIKRPGDSSAEIAAVCACFLEVDGDELTKLEIVSLAVTINCEHTYRYSA
jgi:hypothetical protein